MHTTHLPPWKHGGDTLPSLPRAAPKHQDNQAQMKGEEGLIEGDATAQLYHMQLPLPPELCSHENKEEDAPNPADGSWRPTPRRHGGPNQQQTIHPNYTGASPQPSPDGSAAGEGLGSAQIGRAHV